MEATMNKFQGLGLGGKPLKRPESLALDSTTSFASKKRKQAFFLTSPDLSMLTMTTPEMAKYIIENCNPVRTPTPNSHIIISESLTEEKEKFPMGFTNGPSQLHQLPPGHQDNMTRLCPGLLPVYIASPVMTSVNTSPKYSPLVLPHWNQVRQPSLEDSDSNSVPALEFATREEELQRVPSGFSSPPPSDVSQATDTEDQEQKKLEHKRLRNRIAASKCRQRKLEKISQLEDKVKELEGEIARLRQQACHFEDLERVNANLLQQLCRLEVQNGNLRQQLCHFEVLKEGNANQRQQAYHFKELERENAKLREQVDQ